MSLFNKKRYMNTRKRKYLTKEDNLTAYIPKINIFKRIFLLKKSQIIVEYRDEKDKFTIKHFSKMREYKHFYNKEFPQISKERENYVVKYVYRQSDLEYFEKTKEYVRKFNSVFSTELNISNSVNFEELKDSLNIANDIGINKNCQEENINEIDCLYENVVNNIKSNRQNITNQLYSMNRTDSPFTVENITPEKYTEEFFYDSNNDFDMYMNTDADRYYNNSSNYNSYEDDLINHSQPDYLNDPYVWDKQVYDVFKNDNDY